MSDAPLRPKGRARRLWPRAFHYLRPYRWLAGASVLTTVLSAALALAQPWPLAFVVDVVLGDRDAPGWTTALAGGGTTGLIVLAVGASLCITLLGGTITIASEYVERTVDTRMGLDLKSDLIRHVHRMPLSFHDDSQTGNLMFRIEDQADSVGKVVVAVPEFARSLLTLVGMLIIALRIDTGLAMLSMTILPFVVWSTTFYARRVDPELRDVRELEATNVAMVHEGLALLPVTVAFGRERYESERFQRQGESTVSARVRLTYRQALFNLGVTTVTAIGTGLVLGAGAFKVVDGRISAGELLIMLSYVAAVYQPLETLTNTTAVLQTHFVALEHAIDLLDTPLEVVERPDALDLGRSNGAVAFENVSFGYPARPDALRNVSFSVRPGETVAIVGPTGAGKSTLASLMPRLYDPAEGRVLIGGHDARDVTLASLRGQFSVVLQEPLLFSGSIRSNIEYGRPGASDAEIEQAARDANAHDFIRRLPNGYDATLGERGTRISGGERQRIAVARAFLRDAPILILDEPTSSIDSRTEAVILDALERLMEGRTTIVIAHRLSTIRSADHILVLDEGALLEDGTHDELLDRDGMYRQLWEAQTRQRARLVAARSAIADVGQVDDVDARAGGVS
jgi:ATP-binding cassette subfamily B protein